MAPPLDDSIIDEIKKIFFIAAGSDEKPGSTEFKNIMAQVGTFTTLDQTF